MVNPIKFLGRATGISNLLDPPKPGVNMPGAPTPSPAAVAQTVAPPAPAPIVGQEPTQAPPKSRNLVPVSPSIIGSSGGSGQQPSGYVTLLGQAK